MPRQPMFGVLLAASAIALVQCARSLSTEAPPQGPPSVPPPNDAAVHTGEAPLNNEPPAPWWKDLELHPAPAYGPAAPAPAAPAAPGASGARR